MKRLIIIFISILISYSLYSQIELKNKLRGNWILYGIKEMPYYKYDNNFQISHVQNDSALVLEISNEIFRVISIEHFYLPTDTTSYLYEIIYDSNMNPFIDLNPIKKSIFKRQKKDPYGIRGLYIVKLNNSYLTLERLHKESNSLFQKHTIATSFYYFKRIQDSTEILIEESFQGTWFSDLGYNFSFDVDTIMLSKDTCWVQNADSRTKASLDFIIDNEALDYVNIRINTSWGFVGKVSYGKAYWILYPNESEIHFKNKDEIVSRYNYFYKKDKLILIKKIR